MIIENIITEKEAELIKTNFQNCDITDKGDHLGIKSVYNLAGTDYIHLRLSNTVKTAIRPHIPDYLEFELLPINTYTRLYGQGNDLPKHVDRPELDVTLSVQIDQSEDDEKYTNPLYIHYGETDIEVKLKNRWGGIILYGNKLQHSRPPVECEWLLCTFFHYSIIFNN